MAGWIWGFLARSILAATGLVWAGGVANAEDSQEPSPRQAVILAINDVYRINGVEDGLRSHLNNQYAPKFAEAGFVVLTFDYRGWGESDSRSSVTPSR